MHGWNVVRRHRRHYVLNPAKLNPGMMMTEGYISFTENTETSFPRGHIT